MAIKNSTFGALSIGDRFENCGTAYTKVGDRSAVKVNASFISGKVEKQAVKQSLPVQVFVPDPTPEELAAQAVAAEEQKLRYLRRMLDEMVAGAENVDVEFSARIAKSGILDAFTWAGAGVVRAGAEQFVGLRLLAVLDFEPAADDKYNAGMDMSVAARIDRVRESATQEALRGAGDPASSTSPFSNLVEQAKTAAFAKVASKLTELRRW